MQHRRRLVPVFNRVLPADSSYYRFDVLQGSQCFTCTVGMKISKAQYYVEDTDAVVNMMQVCRGPSA